MTPFNLPADTGVSWGAVEFWCGTYRPHECSPAQEVAA